MRSLTLLASIACLLLACGPSNTAKPVEDPELGTAAATDAGPDETPEEKFARQQTDTVNKMCQRLVDCSIEDAKNSKTPGEVEAMEIEKITPIAINECTQKMDQGNLSPRQVVGLRECLGAASACNVFLDCIDSAGKGE